MTKGDLIKFLEPFTDDVEILIGKPLWWSGSTEASYAMDDEGTGFVLIKERRSYG